MPSYESPSNSESNGIYNIYISSIKKFYKTSFAQNRMWLYIFPKNLKNNMPSYESPSNSESNGIYNINISSIKKIL